MRRSLMPFVCGSFMAMSAQAWGMTPLEHAAYERRGEAVVSEFAPRLQAALPERDSRIFSLSNIRFRQSDDLDAKTRVDDDGKPIIEITTGFLAVMDNLAQTSTHTITMNAGACLYDYQIYIFKQITSGNLSLTNMAPPDKISEITCGCANFSSQALLADRYGAMGSDGGFKLNLLFVLLHEIGHHAQGDFGIEALKGLDIESRADKWAVAAALKARIPLQSTLPVVAMLFELEEARSSAASAGTARQRFKNFIDGFVSIIDNKEYPSQFDASVYAGARKSIIEYGNFVFGIKSHSDYNDEYKNCKIDRIKDYGPYFARSMTGFHR